MMSLIRVASATRSSGAAGGAPAPQPNVPPFRTLQSIGSGS
jgi:hypothetical protein